MRFPDVLKNTCDLFSLQETSYLHVLKKSILVFNNSQTTVGVQMVSVFILLVAYHPISHSSFSNISALKQKEFGDFCIVKIICMCFFFNVMLVLINKVKDSFISMCSIMRPQ